MTKPLLVLFIIVANSISYAHAIRCESLFLKKSAQAGLSQDSIERRIKDLSVFALKIETRDFSNEDGLRQAVIYLQNELLQLQAIDVKLIQDFKNAVDQNRQGALQEKNLSDEVAKDAATQRQTIVDQILKFRIKDLDVLKPFAKQSLVHSFKISSDGKYIAINYAAGQVLPIQHLALVDLKTGAVVKDFVLPDSMKSVLFTPDHQYMLIILAKGKENLIVDLATQDIKYKIDLFFPGKKGDILPSEFRFSEDGRKLLSYSSDVGRPFSVLEIATGSIINRLNMINIENSNANANFSYYVKHDYAKNKTFMKDLRTDKTLFQFKDEIQSSELIYSPNGKYIISVWTNTVKAIDILTGKVVYQHTGSHGAKVSISPDKMNLLVSGDDKTEILDIDTGRKLREIVYKEDGFHVQTIVSKNQKYFITFENLSQSGPSVYDYATGNFLYQIKRGGLDHAELSPNDEILLVEDSKKIHLYDLESGDSLGIIPAKNYTPYEFTPDGMFLVTGIKSNEVPVVKQLYHTQGEIKKMDAAK